MIALPKLARVFKPLVASSPRLIDDLCQNVHDVAARLNTPPFERDTVSKANILQELFKPRSGSPIVGFPSSTLKLRKLPSMQISPAEFQRNLEITLSISDFPDMIFNVSVDPSNPKSSRYHFLLNNGGKREAHSIEIKEPDDNGNQTCSVRLDDSSESVEIGKRGSPASQAIDDLLEMRDRLLKRQAA